MIFEGDYFNLGWGRGKGINMGVCKGVSVRSEDLHETS